MSAFYSQLIFAACCCLGVAIGILIYKVVYTKMNLPVQDDVQSEKADSSSGAKERSLKKRRVIKPRDADTPSSENNNESEVTDL